MGTSYRNIIDGEELKDAIGSGDFSNVIKKSSTSAKYIRGYANKSALEGLADSLNINKGLFKQFFGLDDKVLDAYDPYHTQDAKKEEFWLDDNNKNIDGKTIQAKYDEDTNTFKRSLFSEYTKDIEGFKQSDFWYEDPFLPSFELEFDEDSPFFSNIWGPNTLQYFIDSYNEIDIEGYSSRNELLKEFKNVFFKIFEKKNTQRNYKNKPYYITKIDGLDKLNKKFIKYSGDDADKITITLNEDVAMISWYLAELYNNLIYSYKNQRYMFPENLLRFNMIIKINDIRNFVIPQSANQNSQTNLVNPNNTNKTIKNVISPKSQIVYTLHDCNFNFFESRNYGDSIEIGGYGANTPTPQSLSFNIFFKSVTRKSEFPLQEQIDGRVRTINSQEKTLSDLNSIDYVYSNLIRKNNNVPSEQKGFLNQMLTKGAQNVTNLGLNYLDNLEAKLREVRGGVVNDLLGQFRNLTTINKIEPDNVYSPNFNNNTNLKNFGKQVAASLLNDLEDTTRNAANF